MGSRNRVLLLVQTSPSDWAFNAWRDNGAEAQIVYMQAPKLLRVLRRVWVRARLPFQHIWYGDWRQSVQGSDTVIINMSSLLLGLPSYINKMNPNCRVIAWYWNKVTKDTHPSLVKGKAELWSFDPDDCERYGMKFNHQYYFNSLVRKSDTLEHDVYFCGSDSGRGEKLTALYDLFSSLGIRSKFAVVYPRYPCMPDEIKSGYVPYSKICNEISKSRALLEIVREGQSGPTIRQMEALFFGKKLITNNKHVVTEEYYTEENIFLLGERDWSALPEFISSPADERAFEVCPKYEFAAWLRRFAAARAGD